jgi:hypothetical protein
LRDRCRLPHDGNSQLGNERIDVAGRVNRTGAARECRAYWRLHEARQQQDGHPNARSTHVIFEPGRAPHADV